MLGALAIELAADPLDANSAAPRTSTAITATSGTNFTAFLRWRIVAFDCASNASAAPASRCPTFVGADAGVGVHFVFEKLASARQHGHRCGEDDCLQGLYSCARPVSPDPGGATIGANS